MPVAPSRPDRSLQHGRLSSAFVRRISAFRTVRAAGGRNFYTHERRWPSRGRCRARHQEASAMAGLGIHEGGPVVVGGDPGCNGRPRPRAAVLCDEERMEDRLPDLRRHACTAVEEGNWKTPSHLPPGALSRSSQSACSWQASPAVAGAGGTRGADPGARSQGPLPVGPGFLATEASVGNRTRRPEKTGGTGPLKAYTGHV